MGLTVALDIHKQYAEIGTRGPGSRITRHHRIPATVEQIAAFARTLGPDDQVVLESCTNAVAFYRLLCQHAGRVVLSNPLKTRMIAEAKVKTDKVDTDVLVDLLQAGYVPEVWVPDPRTEQLRHLVFHRHGLVEQRTQAKNRVHAILHRNLVAPEMSDLFGKKGRAFLGRVELPAPERELLDADLRVIGFLDQEIATAERSFARAACEDPDIRRMMTVPGIAFPSAVALEAAIGDVRRFPSPGKLVSYFGLNPSVYQTGQKAYTGHISRRGRSHARSVCIEAAHQLAQSPGPFHAFFVRLQRRKPYNVALTALARKLVVLIWHMLTKGEDYHYAPPARTREKLQRAAYVATGQRAKRTKRAEPLPDRAQDKEPGRIGEEAYTEFIRQRFGPRGPAGKEHPNRKATTKKPSRVKPGA